MLKEAYRVLAAKDPKKQTPAEIEKFLTANNFLRQRLLAGMSRFLLNIEKRSLPWLTLRGVGLASKNAVA